MYALFALLSAPAAGFPAAGASAPSDEAQIQRLVVAAQQGDAKAQGELYSHLAPSVFRVLRGLTQSEADAEELLQDTFVRAFKNLSGYQSRDGARFVSWLMTIARNAFFNRRRKLGRLTPLEPELLENAAEQWVSGSAGGSTLDLRSALLLVLAELPERDRWIVTLRYGGELTADEVAEECGVTSANIRKVTQRQREYLKSRLQSLGYSEEDLA
ncbi:MAG: RNA polymerase sigma factor [Polyangiaceae bacterium]|nr:RNA polymerase sigma factor [Polyangiaceae bacterium]MCB9609133.1 RNA polymerase sigma factor [Polyangiaceae bacterium]